MRHDNLGVAALGGCCVLALSAGAASASWYGGDPSASASISLAAFYYPANNGQVHLAFDNFTWTGGAGGFVGVVGGHYQSGDQSPASAIDVAHWQIRTGVSDGVSGTLVASGVGTPVTAGTSFTQFGYSVTEVSLDVPDFYLAPGNYFFAMSLGDAPTGGWFACNTLGTNGVGGPLGDDLSVYYAGDNSNTYWNWVDLDMAGYTTVDVSYFIYEVPAPGGVGALLLGGAAAMRRRRR